MTDRPLLECSDLTVCYGERVAVDRLSFAVDRGEILGLLGPNGSGKSSTIRAIAGVLEPSSGRVTVGGVGRDRPAEYRRQIGLVPQDLAVYDELTPQDNLTLFATLFGYAGTARRAAVRTALEAVRLADQARRPVRSLSGGMQRRVNLACALLHDPPLLVLDEPTVGLDVPSRDDLLGLLDGLRRQGRGVVLATHHLDEAEAACDRVAILGHGRLAAVGTLAELRHLTRAGRGSLEQIYRRVAEPAVRIAA